jgi:hypothetical protein
VKIVGRTLHGSKSVPNKEKNGAGFDEGFIN